METPNSKSILKTAGWTPSRNIDISKHLDAYSAEGYQVSSLVIAFLKSYGDLEIRVKRDRAETVVDFKSVEATAGIYPEHVRQYELATATRLVPIGAWDGSTILLSDSGKFFAGMDNWLAELGETVDDCIDNLTTDKCAHLRIVDVPWPPPLDN